MGYLNVPRITFTGTFWAQPSTVNNISTNYVRAYKNMTGGGGSPMEPRRFSVLLVRQLHSDLDDGRDG